MKKVLLLRTTMVSTLLATVVALTVVGATPALAATPSIPSFDPTSGFVGDSVVLSGDGFDTATAVAFNGTTALFSIDSAIQITATVPDGATTGPISVENVDGTGFSSTSFTVLPLPSVSAFVPHSGVVGSSVTISGTDFDTATAVAFNGTPAVFSIDSASQITATVPDGATSGPISVTNPGGPGSTVGAFFVIGSPKITAFSPHKGPVGTSVTIVGNPQLRWVTRVWFGSQRANLSHISDTELRARVPRGFRDAHIRVKNPAGSATSADVFHQRRIKVASGVTLSLSKHLRASGSVNAGRNVCESHRVVLIQRVVSGHWKTIKKTTTGAGGGYGASLSDTVGKYRAIIKTKLTLSIKCLPDASSSRTHKHDVGGPSPSCTPGYSPCLPVGPSDYDCYGGGGNGPAYTKPGVTYTVTGSDPYGLDADNDGYGCE
jgi:IPT/TIG domain